LANDQLIPCLRGAVLKVEPGTAIRFGDLARLTINHDGVEFLLTREVKRIGQNVTRRWRIYSGTTEEVLPPRFFDPKAPEGALIFERVVGHTHPRPVPFELAWIHSSEKDIMNLKEVLVRWQEIYGLAAEPFARIIWGVDAGETTIFGIDSGEGNAVPPPWIRRQKWQRYR